MDQALLVGVFETVVGITVTLLTVFLVGAVTLLIVDAKHPHRTVSH